MSLDESEKLKVLEMLLTSESTEPDFIDKLIELFKMEKTSCELKAELEEKDGLSNESVHHKGKFIVCVGCSI